MSDVLVDTSVWIAFFRRGVAPPWRPVLVDLLERDGVVIVEPTIAELLYGVRGEPERRLVLELGGGVKRAALNRDAWIAAGDLGRSWRSRGRTLSIVDCLLAAVAMRDGMALWTLDQDFEPLAVANEIQLFRPALA